MSRRRSGQIAAQVAREAGTTPRNLSQIVTGENANPKYQLLVRIAQAAKTTLGALAGESIRMSAEDEGALLGFRDWIDGKLATIDALTEPNTEIIPASMLAEPAMRIADKRFQQSRQSPVRRCEPCPPRDWRFDARRPAS